MRFIALVAVLGFALPTLAEPGKDPIATVEHIFEMADSDRSGWLSPAEYAEARLESFGVSFAECDANGDGRTTLYEYLQLYVRHHPGGPGEES